VSAGFLLDTNVVSETFRSRPHPKILSFLKTARASRTYVCISVLTLGELRKGVAARQARDSESAGRLARWVDETEADFADNILPVDRAVARIWGELSAARPLPVIDTLIAATAIVHSLTLVTRNVRDMAIGGIEPLNPWITD
jgi:toxin FitB